MDDLISRQAAIEIVDRYNKSHMILKGKPMLGAASIVIELEELPSVEVVPVKRGRWAPVTNGRGGFECSICRSYAPSYQDGVEWLSPFCPNCGAKIEAEEGEPHEQN